MVWRVAGPPCFGVSRPGRQVSLLLGLVLLASCGAQGSVSGEQAGSAGPTGGGTTNTTSAQVNAGSDVSVTLPDSRVVVSGTASVARVVWSQVSGPSTVGFQDSESLTTGVAADRPGTYVLRLTAVSSTGQSLGSDDVQLTVNPNAVEIGAGSTPLDHVKSFVRPALRNGHTLVPLTGSSCALSDDVRVELVRHWGYGAGISGINADVDKVVPLVKTNAGRYPVVYSIASIYRFYNNYDNRHPGLPVLPPETYIRDANGNVILDGGNPIVSPLAPDGPFRTIGAALGADMAQREALVGQKISLVVNEGESGLWIPGDRNPLDIWGRDPRVIAAMQARGMNPNNIRDWQRLISEAKARQERVIKENAYAQLKLGRPTTYSWYQEGFGRERGRWAGWPWFNFLWDLYFDASGKPTVSDYSSSEFYWLFANSGFTGTGSNNLPYDMLTSGLREVGGMRTLGQHNFYPWISQGWDGGDSRGIAEDERYVGFLKQLYTAGAIGAVAGYFTCEGPIFNALRTNSAIGAETPTQVRGMINLAKVHALFTFLEPFLRDGELLTGNGDHPYNGDDITTPAMEFNVVGEVGPPVDSWRPPSWGIRKARVLARKMRNADRWLVTAWANTGEDRDIRVTIDPRLGELKLRARKAGSVYIVELVGGQPQMRLVDTDAMNPTRNLFPTQGAL